MGDSTVSSVTVMDGGATSQLLLGLMKGTIYEVTMVAGNSAGKSPSSDPLQQRTAVDCECQLQYNGYIAHVLSFWIIKMHEN